MYILSYIHFQKKVWQVIVDIVLIFMTSVYVFRGIFWIFKVSFSLSLEKDLLIGGDCYLQIKSS